MSRTGTRIIGAQQDRPVAYDTLTITALDRLGAVRAPNVRFGWNGRYTLPHLNWLHHANVARLASLIIIIIVIVIVIVTVAAIGASPIFSIIIIVPAVPCAPHRIG